MRMFLMSISREFSNAIEASWGKALRLLEFIFLKSTPLEWSRTGVKREVRLTISRVSSLLRDYRTFSLAGKVIQFWFLPQASSPKRRSVLINSPLLLARLAFQAKPRFDSFVTTFDSGRDIFAHDRPVLETMARAATH